MEFNNVEIECVLGDITKQNGYDAIVNAANAELKMGGGVAGAIHRAAGPLLEEECRPLAPINPGEAVITGAYNLPNKFVVHCLGPIYGVNYPEDVLLAKCYKNALRLAEKNRLRSIAFPAVSTGIFGYPMEEAAEVALKTVIAATFTLKYIKRVRFVLHTREAREIHQRVLTTLARGTSIPPA